MPALVAGAGRNVGYRCFRWKRIISDEQDNGDLGVTEEW